VFLVFTVAQIIVQSIIICSIELVHEYKDPKIARSEYTDTQSVTAAITPVYHNISDTEINLCD